MWWPWKRTSISRTISSPMTPEQHCALDAAFQKMDEALAELVKAFKQETK